MPVLRSYQCPECQGIFEHLHMRRVDEPPAFCPLCGASTSDVQPEISAPYIGKLIGKSGDQVYRAMEDSSAFRAELAGEQMGVSAADMSAMKITDLKDNTREGETSAASVNNAVSQFMGNTGVGGMQSSEAAANYAAAVSTGPFARAGNAAREGIKARHSQVAAQVTAAGRQGSYMP